MLSKSEFKQAFREAMEARLEADLAAAPQEKHEFSPEFRARMEELFRTGKPDNKKGLSKRGKRILIIAIAAVLALTLTACAVPEIRESIAGFFVQLFGTHVEYIDPAITKESIEEEYGLVPIPDGFSLIKTSNTSEFRYVIYEDENRHRIQFVQAAKGFAGESVDNEIGKFYERNIDGINVRIYHSGESAHAAWVNDGYYFSLAYSSTIDKDLFEEWISNVKKQ